MQTKNPERFLKLAAFTIGLAILVGGTLTNAKNSSLVDKIDASLNSASATNFDDYSVPTKIGSCEQTAAQTNETISVAVENLDAILSGATVLDTKFTDPVAAAIRGERLTAKTIESGKEYEFSANDGQSTFWKCILENHPLFKVVEKATTAEFLGDTQAFANQIEKFAYAIGEQKEVGQFLNFVNSPNGEKILETTALNSAGEVAFKIFEIELTDTNYNELRKALRNRVGVTNLRPAVFGDDSYYWMWGENDKMAASVFPASGKIFGISYQTTHFKAIRRVVEGLIAEFKNLQEKVAYLQKLGGKFDGLTISEFEKLSADDLGPEILRQFKEAESGADLLSADILDVSPVTQLESAATDENFEPLEIPETDTEDNSQLVIPASL